MRRQFSFEREPAGEGTQESQVEASALAATCQPEFLRAVLTIKTFLDEFGGEAYIAAYREKYDLDGNKVRAEEAGDWVTLGYMIHVESVAKNTAKITGAQKEKDARLTQERPLTPPEDNSDGDAHTEANREQLAAIESG